jgi:hypothetical protein
MVNTSEIDRRIPGIDLSAQRMGINWRIYRAINASARPAHHLLNRMPEWMKFGVVTLPPLCGGQRLRETPALRA